ncbi:MAG: HPr family phosphocarrier protein, partial [Glaciihabitans sp.]|nr:HPr family phosphocarrier protein [Glaciihabitans sp.]
MSVERIVTITREHGLHARPALDLVKAVKASGLTVTIGAADPATNTAAVNAASLLAVMAQGFAQGTRVVLTATGDGSDTLLDQASEILGGG